MCSLSLCPSLRFRAHGRSLYEINLHSKLIFTQEIYIYIGNNYSISFTHGRSLYEINLHSKLKFTQEIYIYIGNNYSISFTFAHTEDLYTKSIYTVNLYLHRKFIST
jgi:hypothetical protein